MKASDWEFTNRALVFGLIFGVSFPLYSLDHQNSATAFANWLGPRVGADADFAARFLFALAALLLVSAALTRTWASAYLEAGVVYASELKTEALVSEGPYRHTQSAVSRKRTDGSGHGCADEPRRILRCCFLDGGVFLPADPAGRSRTAGQSGRTL
jgi:hypothetical protein